MIRVGCIGVGAITKQLHIPGIEASEDLVLLAICEPNEDVLKARAEEYHIPPQYCFTDFRELIDCPDVDVVDIAVPNYEHIKIAEYCVQAKKPYGIEKPLALSGEEAKRLCEMTQENNVKNMVFFSYRYKAAARMAREIIESGKLGRIYHINGIYYQEWAMPAFNTPSVWRFRKELCGTGAIGDIGSHLLDLALFITGVKYSRVISQVGRFVNERKDPNTGEMVPVDIDDFSNFLLDTEEGVPCSFQVSRFGYHCPNHQMIEIYCENGVLVYSVDRSPNVDRIFLKDATTGDDFREIEIPEERLVEHYILQMQSLADLMLDKADGLSATVFDGYMNQKILDAIVESGETGQWVDI